MDSFCPKPFALRLMPQSCIFRRAVGAADERSGDDGSESPEKRFPPESFEFFRRVEFIDGPVSGRGLQVLADGEARAGSSGKVVEERKDLVPVFPEADHEPGLRDRPAPRGGPAEKLQRKGVAALGPQIGKEPGDHLDVVIQNPGTRLEDPVQGLPVSSQIRDQDLHPAIRDLLFQ